MEDYKGYTTFVTPVTLIMFVTFITPVTFVTFVTPVMSHSLPRALGELRVTCYESHGL